MFLLGLCVGFVGCLVLFEISKRFEYIPLLIPALPLIWSNGLSLKVFMYTKSILDSLPKIGVKYTKQLMEHKETVVPHLIELLDCLPLLLPHLDALMDEFEIFAPFLGQLLKEKDTLLPHIGKLLPYTDKMAPYLGYLVSPQVMQELSPYIPRLMQYFPELSGNLDVLMDPSFHLMEDPHVHILMAHIDALAPYFDDICNMLRQVKDQSDRQRLVSNFEVLLPCLPLMMKHKRVLIPNAAVLAKHIDILAPHVDILMQNFAWTLGYSNMLLGNATVVQGIPVFANALRRIRVFSKKRV